MNQSKRSFLKQLGVGLASLTVAGRLKAQEEAELKNYQQTYQRNSLPRKPSQAISNCSEVFFVSGICPGPYPYSGVLKL